MRAQLVPGGADSRNILDRSPIVSLSDLHPTTAGCYAIAAIALLGVVVRPWRSPEVAWAVAGALALVAIGAVSPKQAVSAVAKGTDVYLFLVGMMLLARDRGGARGSVRLARRPCCVARDRRVRRRGCSCSSTAVGTVVTVFLSNDATCAVVLTPAVLRRRPEGRRMPSRCPTCSSARFIANAASFVLPISNPANLVVFGDRLPALTKWLATFMLPSLLSIAATFGVLRWLSRSDLAGRVSKDARVTPLPATGKLAAAGIAATAVTLLAASAFDAALGLPTLLAASVAAAVIAVRKREAPWPLLRQISWSVVPLVAGLFVIVEGLRQAGLLATLTGLVQSATTASPTGAALGAGVIVAFACNLMNNLPAGLIAGSVVHAAGAAPVLQSAVAIGIDLGPNLSVTGSLATILWLVALRRQGEHVSGWTFLKTGALAMPVALAAALAGLWLQALLTA